jgi:hypothetical protein
MTSDSEPSHPERPSASEPVLGGQLDGADQRMEHIPHKFKEAVLFPWATSKKTVRPHGQDTWELEFKKGGKVKIIRDMGCNWFVVVDGRGGDGWVHGSWLDFGDCKVHADAKEVYKHFKEDLAKVLVPDQLRNFPTMTGYSNPCTKPECRPLKEDTVQLGICVHGLAILMEGSGCLSYDWLKAERNVWHPDRFARFCHPKHTDRLKLLAEQMFVMLRLDHLQGLLGGLR